MIRCLSCCQVLDNERDDLHTACRKKLFAASRVRAHIDLSRAQIIQDVRAKALRMSLGGAQPKASVGIVKGKLQIVSSGGEYLLKPSNETHPSISENEHFCMSVVKAFGLPVPAFTLVLQDGEHAFLSRRFDRDKSKKYHLEDFASVLSYPAEQKYQASYLDVIKAADRHCRDKGLERLHLFKLILISFVLGNNDLHLKNFSLLDRGTFYQLSPVYDVVCAARYYPDAADLALELEQGYLGSLVDYGSHTGKDFLYLAAQAGISARQAETIIAELINLRGQISEILKVSFLGSEEKQLISQIVEERFSKLQA